MTATSLTLPAAPMPSEGVMDRLAHLAAVRSWTPVLVSAYVRLGVRDRIRHRYRIAVRNAVREAARGIDPAAVPEMDQEALRRDLGRVRAFVENAAGLPHSPGVAVFACESLGLFETVALPRVMQTRLMVGNVPRLAEALASLDGFGRVIVAAIDRTHARFFEVTAFDATELPGLVLPATRAGKYHSDRADAPGWGERSFHNRIREERHRHAARITDRLQELVAAGPCQGVLLAGPDKVTVEQTHFLPQSLSERVLATVRLNPGATSLAEIRRAVFKGWETWETARERQTAEELEAAVGSGWAVNGNSATLAALHRGQARRLLVLPGRRVAGYRCGRSGRLVVTAAECHGEGEAIMVPDVVSEALDEAFRQRIEVEVMNGHGATSSLDRLAAFLRYRA